MDSSRFAISLRFSPASISKRTRSVLTKVAFPRLPLPRTETFKAMSAISLMGRPGQGNAQEINKSRPRGHRRCERIVGQSLAPSERVPRQPAGWHGGLGRAEREPDRAKPE